MNASDFTLYGHHESGNVYKVALFFGLAGQAYAYKHVDILANGTKTEDFTRLNTFREVPVLACGGDVVTQSDVILRYLADKLGRFGGRDAAQRRRAQEWMAWSSNKLTNGIALARYGLRFAGFEPQVIAFYQNRARAALDLVERHLESHTWLAGDQPTIADMSAAGYIYLIDEAKIDLMPWRNVISWAGRLSVLPGWHHPGKLPRADATVAPAVAVPPVEDD
jgi:glutathione S-transferase